MKAPCYQCTERNPGCHGRCEKYKLFKKTIEVENQKRQEATRAEWDWFKAKRLL